MANDNVKRIVVLLEDGVETHRFDTFTLYGESAEGKSITGVASCPGEFQLHVLSTQLIKVLDIADGDLEAFTNIVSGLSARAIRKYLKKKGQYPDEKVIASLFGLLSNKQGGLQ